jgi:hypothetical protein
LKRLTFYPTAGGKSIKLLAIIVLPQKEYFPKNISIHKNAELRDEGSLNNIIALGSIRVQVKLSCVPSNLSFGKHTLSWWHLVPWNGMCLSP